MSQTQLKRLESLLDDIDKARERVMNLKGKVASGYYSNNKMKQNEESESDEETEQMQNGGSLLKTIPDMPVQGAVFMPKMHCPAMAVADAMEMAEGGMKRMNKKEVMVDKDRKIKQLVGGVLKASENYNATHKLNKALDKIEMNKPLNKKDMEAVEEEMMKVGMSGAGVELNELINTTGGFWGQALMALAPLAVNAIGSIAKAIKGSGKRNMRGRGVYEGTKGDFLGTVYNMDNLQQGNREPERPSQFMKERAEHNMVAKQINNMGAKTGGKRGGNQTKKGAMKNPWITFVKQVQAERGVTYPEALIIARTLYK